MAKSKKKEALKALPEEELAGVAGGTGGDEVYAGKCIRCFNKIDFIEYDCLCYLAGHGQHHEPDYRCVCAIGGGGGRCSENRLLFCVAAGGII